MTLLEELQVIRRAVSIFAERSPTWCEGDRIRLTRDGWGKMPAGTFGTVLRVFDANLMEPSYGVMWDTGVKDCVDESMAERLSPLEQLASVSDD